MNRSMMNRRSVPLLSTIASIVAVGLLLMTSMTAAHKQRTSSMRLARGQQLQQTADRNMAEVEEESLPSPRRRRGQQKTEKSKKTKAAKADPTTTEDSSVSGRVGAGEVTAASATAEHGENEDVYHHPKNGYAANSGKYPDELTYNPGYCNICQADRALKSPDRSFTMSNGNTWTCGYLQETVQSVDPASDYAPEAQMCVDAKIQAQLGGCECESSGNVLDWVFDSSSDFLKRDDAERIASGVAATATTDLGGLFLSASACFLVWINA